MRRGDFATAWAVSDAVLAARDPAMRDDPRVPYHLRWVWDGRPVTGRRVLVRCYHGLGDTLQFCRYLPALRARAAAVTIEAQAPLVPLLAGLADRVHPFDPARPLLPDEVDMEIMEVAHALRLPPDGAPYLRAAPSPIKGIGVCWAAGGWDPDRSMPAQALRPLRQFGPLISLQRGRAALDAPACGAADPLGGSMDMGALAHLVAGLDAVVTVDTMVAHLAGALGRPTAVLLKSEADWRWGDGQACAWYDTVATLRQPSPGCWDGLAIAAGNYLFMRR